MPTYGFDIGNNKVEVVDTETFNTLSNTVDAKESKLNATQGAAQTNCNDLTSTGVYYVPSTATNVPTTANYIVLVFPSDDEGSIITQIAVSTGATLFYVRTYVNPTWTSWNSVAASSMSGIVPEVFISTSLPTSSTGKNGDTYYYIQNNVINKMYVKVNNEWKENQGNKGDKGDTGTTPVIQIGTVTSGTTPSVTVDTTVPASPIMSFVLPKGDQGPDGSVSTMTVGTVTTGTIGSQASVSITGTASDPVLNFTIPGTGTIVTGTLEAGETSLVISDSSITENSLLDIYTDTYGVEPTAATVTTGSLTLTFASQVSDVGVKVVVG